MIAGEARQYLLDANVFIEAQRRYYSFDLCPGFWECLVEYHQAGRILSIDRVKRELQQGHDDLAEWARQDRLAPFFASTDDAAVTEEFGQIVNWVHAQEQFLADAKAGFASSADGWLVAYARVHGFVLVTHEAYALDARRKVPIPNVCRAFNIPFVDTFAMLKDLNVRFGWLPSS